MPVFRLDQAMFPKNNVRRLAILAVSQRDDPTTEERQFLESDLKPAECLYSQTVRPIRGDGVELVLVELWNEVVFEVCDNAVPEGFDLVGWGVAAPQSVPHGFGVVLGKRMVSWVVDEVFTQG